MQASYAYGLLQTTITDTLGRATTTLSDLWGRTLEVHPPLDPWTQYTYTVTNQLTKVEQVGGAGPSTRLGASVFATTSLSYDMAGRKTQMVDPDMGTWNYTYNALGNLTRQQDAKNQRISFRELGVNGSSNYLQQTFGYFPWTTANGAGRLQTLQAELRLDGQGLASTTLALQEQGVFVIQQSGGQATGLDGRVTVIFPAASLLFKENQKWLKS